MVAFTGVTVRKEPLMAGETVYLIASFFNNEDQDMQRASQVVWDDRFVLDRRVTVPANDHKDVVIPVTVPNKGSVVVDSDADGSERRTLNIRSQPPSGDIGISSGPRGLPNQATVGDELTATFTVQCNGSTSCPSTEMEVKNGFANAPTIATENIGSMTAGGSREVSVSIVPQNTGTLHLEFVVNNTNRVVVMDVVEPINQPPSVDITNINKGDNGITPDVSISDPDGNIDTIQWELSLDGSVIATARGESPSFNDLPGGTYNLSVMVTDTEGSQGSDNSTFDFSPSGSGDTGPSVGIASVTADGNSIEAQVSASNLDGGVRSIQWELVSGRNIIDTGSGEIATLQHQGPGQYILRVMVTDGSGASTIAETQVSVEDPGNGSNGEVGPGMDNKTFLLVGGAATAGFVFLSMNRE